MRKFVSFDCFAKPTVVAVLVACVVFGCGERGFAAPENNFGIGVGVGFPYYERAGYSKAENYAAVTHDKIIEELTVTEKGGRLKIEFKITNNGNVPYTVSHQNGQEFDAAILDKNGAALWQLSSDTAYTQALTEKNYPPHESVVYVAEIERKTYRKLKEDGVIVTAYLTDTPHKVSTRLPEIYKDAGSSVFGTVIIGSGRGW